MSLPQPPLPPPLQPLAAEMKKEEKEEEKDQEETSDLAERVEMRRAREGQWCRVESLRSVKWRWQAMGSPGVRAWGQRQRKEGQMTPAMTTRKKR
jgi:hypothetical protein